ncbi:MAG TPA: hypothetical protein VHT75_02890 [Acidimicrobiales bacterium]|jgi:hypothetical protein|nr:hypothetical protein [Acidimicrobiales bacterium]
MTAHRGRVPRPTRRPVVGIVVVSGVVVIAGYLIAALATVGLSGRHVLPLFEGIGPPPQYQWVKPPPAFAAGNVKPKPVETDFPLTGPVEPAFVSSPDGQFVVNLGSGAFPRHDPDTKVHATITPLDPASLGPLPPGVAADGNAYRIEFTYQPSKTPLVTLAGVGNVILTAPYQAESLLDSTDGRSWTTLRSQDLADPTMIGSPFTAAGYYIAGTSHNAVKSANTPGSGVAGISAIAISVVAAAVLLGLFALTAVGRRAKPTIERKRNKTTTKGV